MTDREKALEILDKAIPTCLTTIPPRHIMELRMSEEDFFIIRAALSQSKPEVVTVEELDELFLDRDQAEAMMRRYPNGLKIVEKKE